MDDNPHLTIILPTYNEAENIAELIPQIQTRFSGVPFLLFVVDDASPDGTADVAHKLNEQYGNIEVLTPPMRRGLGAALRYAYDRVTTAYILSSDSDMSFSVNQMIELYGTIQAREHDMVLGSRWCPGGSYEAPGFRIRLKKMASAIGNIVVRVLAGLPVTDVSANFRVLRKDAWDRIDAVENTNAMLFEMVFKCHHGGLKVSSIPITFRDRRHGDSKLNLISEIPKFLVRMCYYILRYRLTGYKLKERS